MLKWGSLKLSWSSDGPSFRRQHRRSFQNWVCRIGIWISKATEAEFQINYRSRLLCSTVLNWVNKTEFLFASLAKKSDSTMCQINFQYRTFSQLQQNNLQNISTILIIMKQCESLRIIKSFPDCWSSTENFINERFNLYSICIT